MRAATTADQVRGTDSITHSVTKPFATAVRSPLICCPQMLTCFTAPRVWGMEEYKNAKGERG